MVRQRPRKSVEELYATKFETIPPKSTVNSIHQNNTNKNGRNDRDLTNYIITSNTPYSTTTNGGVVVTNGVTNLATSRRKTARQSPPIKQEKYYSKEEKVLNLDDIKKDTNMKAKTSRNEKSAYSNLNSNIYDNKSFVNFTENIQKETIAPQHQHQHQHQNHRHANRVDDDKDDDTEEFFELIRQTVENAIGKSVSDLLNRNFRELSSKIDRFSSELKATNTLLNKMQTELNNKVVHYGEENSRHFRYLCMKSEYDKMFYQHHTMMVSTPTPDKMPPMPKPSANGHAKSMSHTVDCEKSKNSCKCRTNSKLPQTEPHKTSSEEQSMSNKSSEMGMREVLEHIQRFCTQMQLNELKCDERTPKSSFRMEDAMKINKQVFEEDDDDDFQMSSDGMTPRSDDHMHHSSSKYGANTMRSCSTTRGGNGGGDA